MRKWVMRGARESVEQKQSKIEVHHSCDLKQREGKANDKGNPRHISGFL